MEWTSKRIDLVLMDQNPVWSRSLIKKFLSNGFVKVNGKTVFANFHPSINDKIEIDTKAITKFMSDYGKKVIEPTSDKKLEIIYEDKDLLVINKNAGISTHPQNEQDSSSALNLVYGFISQNQNIFSYKIRPIHRLDKDTSGVLLFAKTYEGHRYYSRLFEQRAVKKIYLALVEFSDKTKCLPSKILRNISENKDSKGRFKVTSANQGTSAYTEILSKKVVIYNQSKYILLKIRLHTGRTHQIRVHLKSLGTPIVGDTLYGGKSAKRLMLHASEVILKTINNEEVHFEAKCPFKISA